MNKIQPLALYAFALALVLSACSSPRNLAGSEMETEDLDYIQELGLLDDNETIVMFNSRSAVQSGGSFYTDRRIAEYRIGGPEDQLVLVTVDYEDIKSITLSDMSRSKKASSFILVTRKNGRSVQVFVDGKSKEVQAFFSGVQRYWMGSAAGE